MGNKDNAADNNTNKSIIRTNGYRLSDKVDIEHTIFCNIREKVGNLIHTDLNVVHAKIKPAMTKHEPKLWEDRIKRADFDIKPPPPSSSFCGFYLFKCF
uniref:Uncharacterized protein n=1 Tax=Megaviridae environmental sample TaxID=1737588 RepID=A0A5J6VL02_9VIRU|nr:MAG: hypothetical protein [Megaviridae environmental sample]